MESLNYNKLSDLELNQLLKSLAPKIGRFIWSLTKEKDEILDITQNVLIKIAKNINSFKGDSLFDTWVFRISYNEGIRFLQKNKKNVSLSNWIEDTKVNIEEHQEKKELVAIIDTLLKKMSKEKQEVFTMFYYTDLPILEISKILSIPVGTVKSRLNKSRTELIDSLKKKGL